LNTWTFKEQAMHQSPQKMVGGSREKYAGLDAAEADGEADRRMHRASQPKARKFPLREELAREERAARQHPRS
jgi:hypothetical protein